MMGASKSSNSSEFEEDRRIGREKEGESTVQNLHKASSDVTAALFALELITQSDRPQDELVSNASKLLSEAVEELKKALRSSDGLVLRVITKLARDRILDGGNLATHKELPARIVKLSLILVGAIPIIPVSFSRRVPCVGQSFRRTTCLLPRPSSCFPRRTP
jgi:hypothetical protein